MFEADPFGERREDIRAATVAIHQILASSMTRIEPEDANAIYQNLKNYLACHQDHESEVDLDALQRMKEKQCPA